MADIKLMPSDEVFQVHASVFKALISELAGQPTLKKTEAVVGVDRSQDYVAIQGRAINELKEMIASKIDDKSSDLTHAFLTYIDFCPWGQICPPDNINQLLSKRAQ